MREQEVKFKHQDSYSFLLQNAAVLNSHLIIDTYYDIDNDCMLKDDRVLRVRQINNLYYLAFKGRRNTLSSRIVDREEIELSVDGDGIHKILHGLGYYKRDILEKKRTLIKDNIFPELNIVRDYYPFIGEYWEVEGNEKQIHSYLNYYGISNNVLELLNCTELFMKYCTEHNIQFKNIRTAQTFENEREYYDNKHR
jgi:adenylate cyclase class IV